MRFIPHLTTWLPRAPWEAVPTQELELGYEVAFPFLADETDAAVESAAVDGRVAAGD